MRYDLPPAIRRFIADAALTRDEVGESPSEVFSFTKGGEAFYLKLSPKVYAPTTFSVTREAGVHQWLAGKLNVPELVEVAEGADCECMITRAVPGTPLFEYIDNGEIGFVAEAFHEALRRLQAVSVKDCPFTSDVAFRLAELEYLLERGLVADDTDLSQWPGMDSPYDLLAHLKATVPAEDLVFSHGDLGDSNLLVDGRGELHFIDLGRGGLADRWLDAAFVHRNLSEEVSEEAAGAFVAALGVPDAPAKRRYFVQLDEMF